MIDRIQTKIFADGADLDGILKLAADPLIKGFTTNPTLMWKAGLTDYEEFAKRLLEQITVQPISFEVFADDEAEMRRQAKKIATWGANVYVKIPVTTTGG
jgi:transaldolase